MIPELHLVMHGVAIKKHGTAADIASVAGLSERRTEAALKAGVDGGRLIETGGRYVLSPAGQMIVAAEYSRFRADLRHNAAFMAAATERFERVNLELKQLITDWQTLELGGKRVPNDHSDKAHDEAVIARLGELHDRFEPILKALVAGEPRLGVYARKLGEALEQAEEGKLAAVSDARTESYHTVWFELHEDLLRLTGRQREE